MTRFFYAILMGIIGAVIVHICVILLVPHFSQTNIWSRLQNTAPEYVFTALDDNNPIIKTADPLFHLKACRFNLDNGPVRLNASENASFWSLSVYNREGINFYSLNDRTMPHNTLDLVIGTPGQIMELKQSMPDSIANSVLVSEELSEGFVILRKFSPNNDFTGDDFLTYATCRTLDY